VNELERARGAEFLGQRGGGFRPDHATVANQIALDTTQPPQGRPGEASSSSGTPTSCCRSSGTGCRRYRAVDPSVSTADREGSRPTRSYREIRGPDEPSHVPADTHAVCVREHATNRIRRSCLGR